MEPKTVLKLGELTTNQRGGKFFPVCAEAWRSREWLRILWHPSPYGSETEAASQKWTRDKSTLSLMKLFPREEVLRQDTKRPSTSDAVR